MNLTKNLKGLKIKALLAPLFKLLEAILELLIPLIIADIIDNGIPSSNKNYILIRFAFLLGFGLLGFGFAILAQYFSAKVASKFSSRIRSDLFKHIQSLSYKELDQIGTPTLLTRITSDVNQIQTGVNMLLRLFLRSPFIVFGALVMAMTVDLEMALIFVVVIPLLFFIVGSIIKITLPKYKNVQTKLDNVSKEARENLTGVRVIRAFTSEEEQQVVFKNKNEDYSNASFDVSKISSLMNPLTYLVVNLGVMAILYFGGINVNIGGLTNGQVVALYNYMTYILVEVVKLANLVITLTKGLASYKRVNQVFLVNNSLNKSTKQTINQEYLSFENVSFKYNKNGNYALENISFKVNKNEMIGIIGSTGSGKSTLINLLGHFYDVSEGIISLEGYNINSYENKELREKISYVPQKAVLFEGSIRSNLLWGNSHAKEEELIEALKMAQAMDVVSSKEKGLDEEVEQNGRNFSGGQKQRLTIARALVKKPEILILDDSSSALDFKTDKELQTALLSLKNKMNIFIISQRTSSLLKCDKIIVLEQGKMVDFGSHEELLKRCSIYKEIHYSIYEKEGDLDE